MRISLITICFNRKATISKTIKSVLSQDYNNIEYIIIDGNSNDGTKEIIQSFGDKISKFVSEPDNGLYDAINKGIQLATGEVIGLMHSDDEFYDTEVVSKIVETFNENPNSKGVYGNGIYVSNDEKQYIVRNRISGVFSNKKLKSGWLPLHTAVYFKKEVFEKHGLYNLDYKIASDTELLLRYLYKDNIELTYLNTYFVKMRMGGLSTNHNRFIEILLEDIKIYKNLGLPAYKIVFFKKMLTLRQYLK